MGWWVRYDYPVASGGPWRFLPRWCRLESRPSSAVERAITRTRFWASIAEAATEYGQSEQAMVRVARCESTLNPCALNSDGPYYGLYQFLKSIWRSTPYGDRDISIHKPKLWPPGGCGSKGAKTSGPASKPLPFAAAPLITSP